MTLALVLRHWREATLALVLLFGVAMCRARDDSLRREGAMAAENKVKEAAIARLTKERDAARVKRIAAERSLDSARKRTDGQGAKTIQKGFAAQVALTEALAATELAAKDSLIREAQRKVDSLIASATIERLNVQRERDDADRVIAQLKREVAASDSALAIALDKDAETARNAASAVKRERVLAGLSIGTATGGAALGAMIGGPVGAAIGAIVGGAIPQVIR